MGILANVSIASIASTAWVVSGGMIGDLAGATSFSCSASKLQGVLAAEGNINGRFALTAHIFKNTFGTANGDELAAIFTDSSKPLSFDNTSLDLAGLALIQADLTALSVDLSGNFSGTTV